MIGALLGGGVSVTPEAGAVRETIQRTTCTKALTGQTAATAQ